MSIAWVVLVMWCYETTQASEESIALCKWIYEILRIYEIIFHKHIYVKQNSALTEIFFGPA